MCIYVISAQFIRNNAKQSRKINPPQSLVRDCPFHSLPVVFTDVSCECDFIRILLFRKFDEIIYSHSVFHYNGSLSSEHNKVVLHV